jgi:hypothetical protein
MAVAGARRSHSGAVGTGAQGVCIDQRRGKRTIYPHRAVLSRLACLDRRASGPDTTLERSVSGGRSTAGIARRQVPVSACQRSPRSCDQWCLAAGIRDVALGDSSDATGIGLGPWQGLTPDVWRSRTVARPMEAEGSKSPETLFFTPRTWRGQGMADAIQEIKGRGAGVIHASRARKPEIDNNTTASERLRL